MSLHRLSELQIEGREKVLALEPTFDFHRIRTALRIVVDFGQDLAEGRQSSMVLTAEYRVKDRTYDLTMSFDGIQQLVLPEMQPFFHLAELEIEDVSERMLDGVNFEAIAHFDRGFRCTCRGIVIVSFTARA